ADQLIQEIKDEESQLYLDVIRRNSARISTIITELLNSSRFHVLADRSKLKIAFMNLVVNAIEAMEQVENASLLLSLSSGENQVVCEVTDNGCGIPAENLGRLFEPYYTSKRNGMGLGLASTMNIIQSHKGYIEVHSKPGKGTTFLVHLPLE
nr:ATP-binding protein [Flavihumibacter sp.]